MTITNLHRARKTDGGRTRRVRFGALLLAAALVAPLTAAYATAAGADLSATLQALPHRRPGTPEYAAAFAAVSNRLVAAGLTPHLQTFDSLAPRTHRVALTIGDTPVAALPVDNGLAPLVLPAPLCGPVVLAGDGSLAAIEGLDLTGAVAAIELGPTRPQLMHVFMAGARAVLLLGSPDLSVWSLNNLVEQGPASVPMLYVPPAATDAVRAGAGRIARLDAAVRLEPVRAQNLWVMLPGESGRVFNLQTEETLVLSARLDTWGLVPDASPDRRHAANAALLADTVAALSGQPRARGLLAVFWGAHYAAQEGARHFYHALSRADRKPTDRESLEWRRRTYTNEIVQLDGLIKTANPDTLATDRTEPARQLAVRLKLTLAGRVNRINSELRDLRLAENARDGREPDPATRLLLEPGDAATFNERLLRAIATREAAKSRWNGLRLALASRKPLSSENRSAMVEALDEERAILLARRAELEHAVADVSSWQELADALGTRAVVAHLDFDLADPAAPWLLGMGEDTQPFMLDQVDPGGYLLHLTEFGKATQGRTGAHPGLLPDALTPFFKPFSLCNPIPRPVPTSAAVLHGLAGFQLLSAGVPLDDDGLPGSRARDLAPLAGPVRGFVDALLTAPGLSLRRPLVPGREEERLTYLHKGGTDYTGLRCVRYSRGSAEVEGPAAGAVLAFGAARNIGSIPGVNRFALARVNGDGYVFMPGINRSLGTHETMRTQAFAHGPDGRLTHASIGGEGTAVGAARLPLFVAFGGGAFSFGFAPDLAGSATYQARTLVALTDSPAKVAYAGQLTGMPAYFNDRGGRIKRIGTQGELLLGTAPDSPLGRGVPMDPDSLLRMNGIALAARDAWRLNESRLDVLRRRNIINNSLEQLHADAEDHLRASDEAAGGRRHAIARAHDILATCLANRVYAPLRAVTQDLIKAVVVLLILSIPFAFALERLVFGFTSIHKQVAGFVGIFLATFGILYVTHPAFSLAAAPIVIFLAFVIILLGAITLHLVMGKIRHEIRAIQGLASTVHGTAEEGGTTMAAILIGISGMRNRPLKTALTALTVVLLTFTILVFASFTAELGVVETHLGKGQDEHRIEVHRFSHLDFPVALLESVETLHGKDFAVFRRGGLFLNPTRASDQGLTTRTADRVIYNPLNGRTVGLGAIMGLDAGETRFSARWRALAPALAATAAPDAPAPIYLPAAAADKLALEPGQTVLLSGRPFRFAGALDAGALQRLTTLDNLRVTPPDFAATVKNMGKQTGSGATAQELERVDTGSLAWFSADQVALTDLAALQRHFNNVNINFISLYPHAPDADIEGAGRALARALQAAVHTQTPEGVRRLFLTRAVAGSGFRDVLIPMLLGGLIIFSSLMGSIVDREREIFTYSALGLSPPSVAALFFAESSVYSVIGGMGGYLFSQLVAKLLVFLKRFDLFTPPAMNFSSLSSVLTILIVMAIVMLSTIYPALKAGRSANPGVSRVWRMPAPRGNRLRFVFPFTVGDADFAGILSFMREHFENHGDATLGAFAARQVRLFKRAGADGRAEPGIQAEISLAPFDLGVFQRFEMYAREFEIPGIAEVVVEIERIGGAPATWLRGNRGFAQELRRQFLLWRSLPIETIEHYRAQSRQVLADAETRPASDGEAS